MKKRDGSVISSYFGHKPAETGKSVYEKGGISMIGQIEKIHFTDDTTNVSKEFVEYDVSVRDAYGGQSVFRNCRLGSSGEGGTNNFGETILEANEFAKRGKLDISNFFGNKNGTIVVVSFTDNSLDKPYISDVLDHPEIIGAKRADGVRKFSEFNGIRQEITKDGEFCLTYFGGKLSNGENARPGTAPSRIKIDKLGNITLEQFEGTIEGKSLNKIFMDRVNELVNIKGGSIGDEIIISKEDGIFITTSDGAILKLADGKVGLGADSAELLEEISNSLAKIITWTNTVGALHTHLGNLGYETAIPTQTAGYLTLGSDLTAIKALIDGIKGGI